MIHVLSLLIFVSVPEFLPPYFFFSRAFPEWPRCCILTAVPYWIIMKSKTPEKFEQLLPMIIDCRFPDDFMCDTHTIPVETDHVFYA
jgi:hypothetical protein